MADHHTRHNPLGQDALFTTPASLMLDARLTPLKRNGWQVLRMLRSAEGISPLANLGQLRRYLTSTPLGHRAGYETARRVLIVLRLTGWISLVGQQRDPLTGHVLSELYQVHESALHFQQACTLDASLSALLQASIGHENNQVDRVSHMHGLRHQYAQSRYEILTGWPAPAAGGPSAAGLSPTQRIEDRRARQSISRELGHERIQITAIYLGS